MPEKENKERRQFKRIKKNLYVQCGPWNKTGAWNNVILQDISKAGLSFASRQEFAVDEMLEIRLCTFIRRQPISVVVRVVGCGKMTEGKNWITRASIVRINDEDVGVFEEVIETFLKGEEDNKQVS